MTRPPLAEAAQLLEQGRLPEARRICERILAEAPGDPEALFLFASALAMEGAQAEAIPLFRRCLDIGGPRPELLHNLGLALANCGDHAQAERAFFLALLHAPRFAEAAQALGLALVARGDLFNAAAAFRRAVEEKPDWTEARLHLAKVLSTSRQAEAALKQYRELLDRQPGNAHFMFLVGAAAYAAGQMDDAETVLRRALLHAPRDPGAMNNLGLVLSTTGKVDEAAHYFRQAVAIRPDYHEAWGGLASALDAKGDSEAASQAYDRVLAIKPDQLGVQSNRMMMLTYREEVGEPELYAAHAGWGARLEASVDQMPAFPKRSEPSRRLRIGYVSPDFRLHSVSMFFLPLLDRHDRQKFEIFAYSNVDVPDVLTGMVRAAVDHWRDIHGLDDAAVAAQIRADEIDLLIDLAGHTAGNRLRVFAFRPARVQATWLGYPATTGLSTIDWRFTDEVADPRGDADLHHSEKLARVEGGFLCYRPLSQAPEPAPPPCLQNGFVTFGSYNTLNKVTPSVAALWSRVLHAVPGSKLLLKSKPLVDPSVRARMLAMFADHGIPAERIELRQRSPMQDDHLHAYGWMDIALDPFPYNGTTTTCEALWMGVPVLTLAGARHAARVGASIMTALGRPDLIAADADDFVRLAVRMANDQPMLVADRKTLRSRMQASGLCDANAFARAFERRCVEICETSFI